MTIQDILHKLAREHENEWPQYAVRRFAELSSQQLSEEREEYALLYRWILSIVEKGIAFEQTSDIQH